MSDDPTIESNEDEELAALKARADLQGIKYHPNISAKSLAERLAAQEEPVPAEIAKAEETPKAKAARIKREATALKRVRITCMNPAKAEWEGEIITAGNSYIGMIRKYVAFDVPYHVPEIILGVLQDRNYQSFTMKKDKRTGANVPDSRLVKEFAIEILDPLNEGELKDLAQRQAMASGTAA